VCQLAQGIAVGFQLRGEGLQETGQFFGWKLAELFASFHGRLQHAVAVSPVADGELEWERLSRGWIDRLKSLRGSGGLPLASD
jgi:hypothetical protein